MPVNNPVDGPERNHARIDKLEIFKREKHGKTRRTSIWYSCR